MNKIRQMKGPRVGQKAPAASMPIPRGRSKIKRPADPARRRTDLPSARGESSTPSPQIQPETNQLAEICKQVYRAAKLFMRPRPRAGVSVTASESR